MSEQNQNNDGKNQIKPLVHETSSWMKNQSAFIKKSRIRTWQGLFLLFFAAGVVAATIFAVFTNIQMKSKAATGTAQLSWDANTESDLAGYKLYYGTTPRTGTKAPGGYSNNVSVGKATSYALSNLAEGQTYYFSLTAYDTSNNESDFSSEVSKLIPVSVVTCTGFTYSVWGTCQSNGTQTRTVVSSSPSGCTGGSPVLSQNCTFSNTCTSFTYSAWSTCVNNTQTRTVVSSSPSGCTGGNPVLTQSCTPSSSTCTIFKYSKWSACVNSLRSRTVISSSPTGCSGGSPLTSQTCRTPGKKN